MALNSLNEWARVTEAQKRARGVAAAAAAAASTYGKGAGGDVMTGYTGPGIGFGGGRSSGGRLDAIPSSVIEAASGRLPPAREREAGQPSLLDRPQQAMQVGDPIPLAWCRYRADTNSGGVLVFPRATMAAFANNATTITSRFHCVISQGQIPPIKVQHFRVGSCRVGSFSQNYGQRAGTWSPANTLTPQAGYQLPNASQACGGGGDYRGLSVLEFSNTVEGGSDKWNLGCNVFLEGGHIVTRLLDNVQGPSDNIADLILWALRQNGARDDLIDLDSFIFAAKFTDVNGFYVNAYFEDAGNLGDWILKILPYYLLRITRIKGKIALRPLVPTDSDGQINIDQVQPPVWTFQNEHIKPGSWRQEAPENGKREDPHLALFWRQQDPAQIPVKRDLTLRPIGARDAAETHDIYHLCATEKHASKVAAFLRGQRYLIQHTGSVSLRPGGQTGWIREGDICQLRVTADSEAEGQHVISEFYCVEALGFDADGSENLTLSHWPVDEGGRSLIGLEVAQAQPQGSLLPWPTLGTCDLPGRATDTTVPAQTTTTGQAFSEGGGGISPGPDTSLGGGAPGAFNGPPIPPPQNTPQPPQDPAGGVAPPSGGPPIPGLNGGPAGASGPPSMGSLPPASVKNLAACPNGDQRFVYVLYAWEGIDNLFKFGMREKVYVFSLSTLPVITKDDWPGIISPIPEEQPERGPGRLVQRYTAAGYGLNGETLRFQFYGWSDYKLVMESVGCGPSGPTTPVSPEIYIVKKGDTLSSIAKSKLGDESRWPEIQKLNNIKNPNLIFPNQPLELPS